MLKNKCLFFLLCINLSTLLFVFASVNNVYASVDKIIFINDPQIIKVGEFSKQYQIQLENSSGEKEVAPDTTYFTLPLDIGSFYSKTDSEPFTASSSIYIATNSSNKYFYFKSDIVGEYVMKVYARNKDNTKQWETEQIVNVIDATSTENTENSNSTSTATASSTNTTKTTVITRTVYVSSHSSPEDLSDYSEKVPFETTAGRERMALIGSPVEFNAKYNLSQKDQCSPSFRWSYGDGFEGAGKDVIHSYKYQGEYQVVLNGSCGAYSSISRTIVKIVAPNISILNLSDGDIEVLNNGNTEINIGDWKIKGIQKDFIFPKDTIISAGNKIILSKEDSQPEISSDRLSLNNPLGKEVAFDYIRNAEQQTDISQSDSYMSVSEAEKLLSDYKSSLAVKNKQIDTSNVPEKTVIPSDNTENISQVASVVEAVSSSSARSFWAKLIDIPVNGIKSFARIFYDF
jgi:hypothetical protein